jgi:cytochrome oxidase assembly protein ShyY1
VRYRFAWSPRWIAGHLIVLGLCVAMVNLGLWQLRRLDEKQDRRDTVRAQLAAAPVPLSALADPQPFQHVSVHGEYDGGATLLIANRSYQGQAGYEVVTPLVPADGGAPVLVDRGWLPLSPVPDRLPPLPPAPAGLVTVVGFVDRQPGDAVVWDTGASTDGSLVRGGLPSRTTVQLAGQEPPLADDQPVLLEEPDTGLGPHLSYALQWFVFTAMLLVFWPLLIRRSASLREKAARAATADAAEADGRGASAAEAAPANGRVDDRADGSVPAGTSTTPR